MPKLADITEDAIALLVDTFYDRIHGDPVLGPVFHNRIAPADWPRHLATMRRFWSSVMLTSGQYSGNPVGVHRGVAGLERPMFARWLSLFEQTATDLFEPEATALFAAKANRIAGSLELAVFHRLDSPPDGLRLPVRRAS
jgi:hemoglobin